MLCDALVSCACDALLVVRRSRPHAGIPGWKSTSQAANRHPRLRIDMPAAGLPRADAWARGDWDASWYYIECYAEYWEGSEKEVMDYVVLTNWQSEKDQFLSARSGAAGASTGPAKPRKPAYVTDNRFAKRLQSRKVLLSLIHI